MDEARINDLLQVYRQNRFKAWRIGKTRVIPDRQRVDLVGNKVKSILRAELQVFFQDIFRITPS